jgi:hypothetical protein
MGFLISLGLACALAQGAPEAKDPDAALFDALIQMTDDLQSFVAVYRVHVAKQADDFSIRITFRAPGEMRCDMAGKAEMCLRDGTLEARTSSSDGKPMVASVPFAEQASERWSRLTDVLHQEFAAAASDWPTAMSYGPQVAMNIAPDGQGLKENFQFNVQYAFPRKAVLGWLEAFKDWSGTKTEDEEHIVFRTSRGSEVSLSKRTGFIDSIRKRNEDGDSSFVLEKLELDPKLDEHSFELSAAAADATDASDAISAQLQRATTHESRRELFAWIARHVSDGKIEWNAEARAHIGKVLQAIHSDAITLENEPWIAETKQWIESSGSWMRGEFEAKAQEARKNLFDRLQALLKTRLANLEIQPTTVPDATLRASLLDLERSSIEAALEHSVQDPMLEAFDAQVQRAKSGG